jgi:[ribosomal protein S5]-alanine N-acetyltransferase
VDRWFPTQTARLLLREFRSPDEADVHEYASDVAVTRYMDWGPNTAEKTHEIITARLEDQCKWPRHDVMLAVELLTERKVIGTIRLTVLDRQCGIADTGFVFNRRYWNQGYATEAVRAVLGAAFSSLGLHRVWATCDTRNIGSWRVMEKAGMRREGMFRKDVFQKGEWRDSYLYARLKDDTPCRPSLRLRSGQAGSG